MQRYMQHIVQAWSRYRQRIILNIHAGRIPVVKLYGNDYKCKFATTKIVLDFEKLNRINSLISSKKYIKNVNDFNWMIGGGKDEQQYLLWWVLE